MKFSEMTSLNIILTKKNSEKKMLTSSMLIKNKLFAKVNQKYFFLEKKY